MTKKSSNISSKKPFERHIYHFVATGRDRGKIFNDFLELTVSSFTKNEEVYESIKSRYSDKDINVFSSLLADLIQIEEEKNVNGVVSDYLGNFYMEHITFWEHGQYFTPQHISDFMAQIVSDDIEWSVLDKMPVNDPACGSGRMALWYAKAKGQRNVKAVLMDLDRRCSLMAYINMVLSSIDCEVYQADSLMQKYYDWWSFKLWWWSIPICNRIIEFPKIVWNTEKKPQEKISDKKELVSLF